MGKRGPAPRPTNLRILHGDKPSRINYNEPKPRDGIPNAPSYMDEDAKRVWRYTLEQLRPTGMVTKADRDMLAAYCVAVVQFERATRLVQQAGVLIKGRKDGVVKNPAAQIQRDAFQMMKQASAEFGLTPRARAEIKVDPDVSEDELQRLLS